MGRQKTKISDRFKSGGNKDGSAEEKFFTDVDHQIDPEWKVFELLRAQVDDITDAINANDAGSGSFATDIRSLVATSGSLSTRVTRNDGKATNVTTNLTATTATTQITINSSDGDNVVLAQASDSIAGVMTVAHHDKLDGIETSATADQSNAEILTAIEDGVDSVHYVDGSIDTDHIAAAQVTMAKLANIATDTFIGRTASSAGVPKALSKTEALAILNVENGATADQSDAEILTAIEDGVDSVHYKDGSIDTEHIADDQVTTDKLADSINTAIAANTSKVGFVTTMPTATADCTCTLTVTKNRGVPNALVFTVIDSSGRSPVTKTATISLS